ncbi:MGT family glycosyltransferase [Allocatelliglobosispora scoriae]|uniref:MGT family glycosyltransferase n=1 Tax=Allocatelliglobosispora scoriae TaxID=643052 RepID=A0A841BKV4_9ACTN|nr:nucleotide disphospho-sugar-binding domain-containing protein [Allocatelliglobosispora scoriae]MBB5867491.1 MGT family glycosyltransferase [Allocatelliglobosispora scoriae]
MARVLICGFPQPGHFRPMLSIARRLLSRGHEVCYYTSGIREEEVRAAGMDFEPFRSAAAAFDELGAGFTSSSVKDVKDMIRRVVVAPAAGYIADISDVLRRRPADVLVVDLAITGPGWLYETGNAPPWATVNLALYADSDPNAPPFGLGMRFRSGTYGRMRNGTLRWIVDRIFFREVMTELNALRRSHGLEPAAVLSAATMSPLLYVQAGSLAAEYPRRRIPPQVHFVGVIDESRDRFDPPQWWHEVAESTRPVVHVTQGTVATQAESLLIPAMRALADDDVLVVATTGGPDVATLGAVPRNARVAPLIPHSALLPHVTVMITNGGYGAMQTALAHGIPLVMAGTSEDKPDACARVEYVGAGIDLRTATPDDASIRDAVLRVLHDPRFRAGAETVAADLARHHGAAEAAALIENLAAARRPVLRQEHGDGTPRAG